jgi:uncharacterized RDD family membrane protein YckC
MIDDPFVAPQAAPSAGLPADLVAAGFAIRALARVLDQGVQIFVAISGGCVGGVALAFLPGAGGQPDADGPFTWVAVLLGSIVYHSVCEAWHGATLGKLVCGLRVVSEDGERASLVQGLMRSVAFLVDSLFLGAVGFVTMQSSPRAQRVGDKWARTVVVHAADEPLAARQPFVTFVAAFVVGAGAGSVLCAAGMVLQTL